MQGVADYRAKKISAEEYAHRKQLFDDAAKEEAQKAAQTPLTDLCRITWAAVPVKVTITA